MVGNIGDISTTRVARRVTTVSLLTDGESGAQTGTESAFRNVLRKKNRGHFAALHQAEVRVRPKESVLGNLRAGWLFM